MRLSASGVATNSSFVGWTDSPDGRGTTDLLLTCFATLTICVWTSLHLNIPGKGESRWTWWKRHVRWVGLGTLCSELVVLVAWRQFTCARSLRKDIISLDSTKIWAHTRRKGSRAEREKEWTITHSYSAIMGGFVFDLDEKQQRALGLAHSRLTLTPAGILLLARCGHLPDVRADDLKDKSKQDALAKGIVLLQTGWFLVQCISRVSVDISVTLLETNTISHIFCAAVVFCLWWKKLRDVREPFILQGEWVPDLCAYMYISSRMSGDFEQGLFKDRTAILPELGLYALRSSNHKLERRGPSFSHVPPSRRRDIFGWLAHAFDPRPKPKDSTDLEDSPSLAKAITTVHKRFEPPHLGHAELGRIRASERAIKTYEAVRQRFDNISEPKGPDDIKGNEDYELVPKLEQLVVPFMSDWPDDNLLGRPDGQVMGLVLWFASMINGAIHLAAWRYVFPTRAEQIIWRFSAGYITASGGFWLAGNAVAYLWPTAASWYLSVEKMRIPTWQMAFIATGEVICGTAYVFARFYLLVESFVSLRRMPSNVYETVNWSNTIPHL